MKTAIVLTPKDHGRHMTEEEWESAVLEERGPKIEIIDAVVQVSPPATVDHDDIADWLHEQFSLYRQGHRRIVNRISQGCAVRVPNQPGLTEPQPDLGLYLRSTGSRGLKWKDIEPFLVVEILSEGDPEKDQVRNLDLYRQVPGIREYWIVDPLTNVFQPTLTVYRKRGSRWQKPIVVAFGETYETPRLLPGFRLVVDPNAR